MLASSLINFSSHPKIYKDNSKIVGAGYGLFAKKHIARGELVVVYYGTTVTDEEIYDMYMDDPDNYFKLVQYIRGGKNQVVINGQPALTQDNLLLSGVYVNDVAKLDGFDLDKIRAYAKTSGQCNLRVVDTDDYPVYYSQKRIKKGEELTVHYGIGYWLAVNGFSPAEISGLNHKYQFSSLYNA